MRHLLIVKYLLLVFTGWEQTLLGRLTGCNRKVNIVFTYLNPKLSAPRIMRKVMGNKSSCPTQGDKVVELIYIDIVGLTQFKKMLGPSWVHYQ